jgi:signal transduction histidine kinase
VLPSPQRLTLDSVASAVQTGTRIHAVFARDTGWRVHASDPLFNRVQSVPLRTGTLLVYAVDAATEVRGVNRVVVARVLPPTPFSFEGLLAPLIIVGPLIILAAAIAAHYAVAVSQRPIEQLINDVEAITDGRSLHRRLAMDEAAGGRLERLTETLNAMIARLETSFGSLRLFTADASHELKTPLTVLRADVERAMAATTTPAERLEALEEALAETTRMADLVESLLTLSRADEGRFDLHREPVDLASLAREVYETALLLGELRNVKVEMNRVEPLTVPGDRARLRQLWLNLVENAIKYTPEGGLVQLMLWRQDGSAQFVVRDSGIGIAAADLPHVFDRFWRADRARSRASERGGFGLGLAISQYIAQAHGGSLTAQSRLGRGSTFVVDLPLSAPDGNPTES